MVPGGIPVSAMHVQRTLPVSPAPLIGRSEDLEVVCRRLLDPETRLLSLTGPGGVGKTHLAMEVARRVADAFVDGVWFVDLSPLRSSALVLPAIAAALNVGESGQRSLPASLIDVLHAWHVLLVLDNTEHVSASANDVAELLSWCPTLRILATGRSPLRIRAEREHPVAPLPVGEGDVARTREAIATLPAVALFVERVRTVDPRFRLTEANAVAVASICRHLDGLPLAIELVASQLQVMGVTEVLRRLERRLPLGGQGAHDLPARQQTMERALAWSHDLLTADEQRLFRRLAISAGAWTAETAVALDGGSPTHDDPLHDVQGIAALVRHNLVRRMDVDDPDAPPRFRMLETTRAFALEKLAASGEAETIARRHALHLLDRAQRAAAGLRGPLSAVSVSQLEADQDDLRAALSWAITSGEGRIAVRMAAALWRFWYVRGQLNEGRGWLHDVLGMESVDPCAERADILRGLAAIVAAQGDERAAAELADDAMRMARTVGEPGDIARSALAVGNALWRRGDLAQATRWYEEGLAMFRSVGDRMGVAAALTNLGTMAAEQGCPERAQGLFEEALQAYRALGDQRGTAISLLNLGQHAVGDHGDAAVRYWQEALSLFHAVGDQFGIAQCLQGLAASAALGGAAVAGVRLLGAAEALRERIGWSAAHLCSSNHDSWAVTARERMGKDVFRTAWSQGQQLALDQAVLEASALGEDVPPAVQPRAGTLPVDLTAREIDVLRCLTLGMSNAEIARQLILSPHTIDAHLRRIYRKLDVRSRSAATRFAVELGLA